MANTRGPDSVGSLILCYDASNEAAETIAYAAESQPGSRAVAVSI